MLKQQVWRQGEDISRFKAEAEQQAALYGEELRMLDDERNTAEAAAAHENQMLRLELTRLREETRACRHAKRQSAELSQARWEAEGSLAVSRRVCGGVLFESWSGTSEAMLVRE